MAPRVAPTVAALLATVALRGLQFAINNDGYMPYRRALLAVFTQYSGARQCQLLHGTVQRVATQ